MLISVVFLLITFIVYAILPKLRNLDGKLLMCYISALAVSFVLLSVVQLKVIDEIDNVCIVLGFVLYLSILISFFCLNAFAFDIWKTNLSGFATASETAKSRRFWKYLLYIFGCSLAIALLAAFIEFYSEIEEIKPNIGTLTCFIHRNEIFFVIHLFFSN